MSELITDDGNEIAPVVDVEVDINPVLAPDKSEAIPSAVISSPHANVKKLVTAYTALHTKSAPIVPTLNKSLRPSYNVNHSAATHSAHPLLKVAVAASDVVPCAIPSPVKTATAKAPCLSLKTSTIMSDDNKKKRAKEENEDKDRVERKERTISSGAQHVRSIVSRFEEPQAKATIAEVTENEVNASRVRALILENEQKIRDKRAALEILNRKPSSSKPLKIRSVPVTLPATSIQEQSPLWKSKHKVPPIPIPTSSMSSTTSTHNTDKDMDMDIDMDMDTVDDTETLDDEDDSARSEETDESSVTTEFSKALPSTVLTPDRAAALPHTLPHTPPHALPHATPVRFSSTTARHIVAPLNKTPSSLNIKLNCRSPIDKSTIKFTVPSHIVPKLVFSPSARRVSHRAPQRLSAGKA